jgi:hypothetical protein
LAGYAALRSGRFDQALPIFVVLRVEESGTLFGEPSIAHHTFERPAFCINRPGTLAYRRKKTEFPAASTAGV